MLKEAIDYLKSVVIGTVILTIVCGLMAYVSMDHRVQSPALGIIALSLWVGGMATIIIDPLYEDFKLQSVRILAWLFRKITRRSTAPWTPEQAEVEITKAMGLPREVRKLSMEFLNELSGRRNPREEDYLARCPEEYRPKLGELLQMFARSSTRATFSAPAVRSIMTMYPNQSRRIRDRTSTSSLAHDCVAQTIVCRFRFILKNKKESHERRVVRPFPVARLLEWHCEPEPLAQILQCGGVATRQNPAPQDDEGCRQNCHGQFKGARVMLRS